MKYQHKLENYFDASLNFVEWEENFPAHWKIPVHIFFSRSQFPSLDAFFLSSHPEKLSFMQLEYEWILWIHIFYTLYRKTKHWVHYKINYLHFLVEGLCNRCIWSFALWCTSNAIQTISCDTFLIYFDIF